VKIEDAISAIEVRRDEDVVLAETILSSPAFSDVHGRSLTAETR
jgi:hypothetical protein